MRTTASLLSLALTSVLAAQDFQSAAAPGNAPQQVPVGTAALERDSGGRWIAHWHPATGTPHAMYGTGLRLQDWRENSLDEARRHADRALVTYRDALGLGSSEFRESIGARMGRSWTFTYDQYFRGLPALGGRADVRINMIGVLAMIGAQAWPIPADFDTRPAIGADFAEALAWQALDQQRSKAEQPGAPRATRLVIWGDIHAEQLAPIHLAWEVPISNVQADGSGPIGRYYIDAKTGAVLHYETDKHECGFTACHNADHGSDRLAALTATGPQPPLAPVPTTVTVMSWTRTGNDAYSALVNIPLQGLVVSIPGLTPSTYTTDANGQFTIDIAAPVNIAITSLNGTHHQPITGADAPNVNATVQPGVAATIQLLTAAATPNEAAHPTTLYWTNLTNEWCRSILGNTTQLNTASNIAPRVNIASTCNAYYTQNTINFYNAGGGCANTAFSTVVAHEWGHGIDERYGGISNTNAEGISEGWGDIIALYLVDSPILGSGFQTAGTGIRNGNNTFTYPYSSTSPHAAGQVWMGFAWRLRDNLRAAFGTPQAIAISNDIVIPTLAANRSTRPDCVREVFIADDDDGNLLNGTPHYDQLSAAAIAKAIPYPERQFGVITHAPLTDTNVELTPRRVVATVVPTTGSFTQVRLHYNDGQNRVRNMIPTGAPNEFQAMLPGRTLGNQVTYHIEAVHSTNAIQRLPESGEYSYRVASEVRLFFDDFETLAPGWTSGQIATQNDWQVGRPAGRTGTGWADPTGGFNSTNAIGNDLGNTIGTTVWNGAYANNVSNWARTPVIDCSGRTGVRLRFMRWLTVQTATADQASIAVNGVQVWVNPSTGNLIDTGWNLFELAIPSADNNPSVQIEFRLVTNASTTFGGWNIDNFEVVANASAPPLAAQLRMLPEQAAANAQMTLQVNTPTGPRPFLLAVGDAAGPTQIPGIPLLQLGGTYFTLPEWTDGSGNYSVGFRAPASVATTGLLWYSQVLTLDGALTNFVTSNQHQNLFTQTP